jgi:hypothetical protein
LDRVRVTGDGYLHAASDAPGGRPADDLQKQPRRQCLPVATGHELVELAQLVVAADQAEPARVDETRLVVDFDGRVHQYRRRRDARPRGHGESGTQRDRQGGRRQS